VRVKGWKREGRTGDKRIGRGRKWKGRRNGEREKKNGGKGKRGILCS